MHYQRKLQRIRPRCFPALLVLAVSFSLVACGGGGGGDGTDDPVLNEELDPKHIFVDAVAGSDGNPGTFNQPFKTITHAMAFVDVGGLIRVREGLYDQDNGERFPINVVENVRLVGTTETGNKPQIIGMGIAPSEISSGTFRATVVLGALSRLVGFHIMEGGDGVGGNRAVVAMPYPFASISNCRITDGLYGIQLMHEAARNSIDDTIVLRMNIGIVILAGEDSRVESTTTRFNLVGVSFQSRAKVDFGGGDGESEGRNVFTQNVETDMFIYIGNTVMAQNNFWDHAPPTEYKGSNPPLGVDVLKGLASTIDTTGARKAGGVGGALDPIGPASGS